MLAPTLLAGHPLPPGQCPGRPGAKSELQPLLEGVGTPPHPCPPKPTDLNTEENCVRFFVSHHWQLRGPNPVGMTGKSFSHDTVWRSEVRDSGPGGHSPILTCISSPTPSRLGSPSRETPEKLNTKCVVLSCHYPSHSPSPESGKLESSSAYSSLRPEHMVNSKDPNFMTHRLRAPPTALCNSDLSKI